ncbi:proline iminopeptidase-family hydrolase [Candidatus Acetothermia bacterium]|jgi:proline-specific peptidase|nr:proline iminopeptidase-family hydrolase [Candidatus Acetothermia bacterium]MCI2432540.1 proline iminopeptidase-family hydrolase [Candidatus Acetothermia bacterium]MCI2436566.1 proline iminopeptidase-family hydrolase [Candidatus Acetothermia bacterium]
MRLIEEGKINVDGYQIWYRRVGNGGIPLLTLHGGPGAGHDYLEPLERLATDRSVIFYDQLGCGKSDQPDDRSLWHIERFVAEVNTVRQSLGLEQIHLLGQSWGGWLAIEYMLSHPQGVVSLILASTSAGLPQFVAETTRLKAELPLETYQTLQRYEAMSDYHHPDYEAAVLEFYKRHVCRLDPWPDPLLRTVANLNGNAVYETMNGPNEFVVIGNLKDWDRTDRLGEISVPTLITVGRHDELTPTCAETLHRGIPNSRMVIFEESAHLAHLEESDRYRQVVADFMAEIETPRQ